MKVFRACDGLHDPVWTYPTHVSQSELRDVETSVSRIVCDLTRLIESSDRSVSIDVTALAAPARDVPIAIASERRHDTLRANATDDVALCIGDVQVSVIRIVCDSEQSPTESHR